LHLAPRVIGSCEKEANMVRPREIGRSTTVELKASKVIHAPNNSNKIRIANLYLLRITAL
jgi:hypothetical protein